MTRAALLLVALAACQTDASVGQVSGVLFGAAASTGTTDAATQQAAVTAIEAQLARPLDLDRIFRQWDTAVPGARERWTLDHGRTPIVSFKAAPEAPWPAIARGDHDATLAAIAAGYAALAAPVFCIFDQDPENAPPALGTPADYAAAYRRVVATFRAAHADNVVWIFNLKSPSYDGLADAYYPGDDVVDWLGASAYNFGAASPGGRWVSFADLVADFLAWSAPHDKPLVITEWASNEDPDSPGRKAAWIDGVGATIHATPQLRALVAFWSTEAPPFDSSPSALAAIRALAADPYTQLRTPSR